MKKELNVLELQKMFGVSRETVRQWTTKGLKSRYENKQGQYMYDRYALCISIEDLKEFLEKKIAESKQPGKWKKYLTKLNRWIDSNCKTELLFEKHKLETKLQNCMNSLCRIDNEIDKLMECESGREIKVPELVRRHYINMREEALKRIDEIMKTYNDVVKRLEIGG